MVERIKQIMDEKELTSSQFADGMDVPRAVLSHVLSGRNKPSLDVILKIADTHSDISLEWLLLGKGEMLSSLAADSHQIKAPVEAPATEKPLPVSTSDDKSDSDKVQKKAIDLPAVSQVLSGARAIRQVMFFYTDGSFESFSPSV